MEIGKEVFKAITERQVRRTFEVKRQISGGPDPRHH